MEQRQQPLMNEGIIEALTCPICYIKYDNAERVAMVLPCGHTFCCLCIKTSQRKCPKCRADFSDSQVTKNYIVHTLLDEMSHLFTNNSQNKIIQKETCSTHKREIDRFCKRCTQLMCSVCHCRHFGSARHIISDVNFRDEIENLLDPYKNVEKSKQDFEQRINNAVESKVQAAEKNKTLRTEEINSNTRTEIQKATVQKEMIIKEAEEDARQKIQLIEFSKLRIINQAEETAKAQIMEIETKAAALREELNVQNKTMFDAAWGVSKELKQKIDALQDLNKFSKESLAECVTIYKLESHQRRRLQEFFTLSNCDTEAIFKDSVPDEMIVSNNFPRRRVEETQSVPEEEYPRYGRGQRGISRGPRGMRGRGELRLGRGMRGMVNRERRVERRQEANESSDDNNEDEDEDVKFKIY